jgi:hypothetical protein
MNHQNQLEQMANGAMFATVLLGHIREEWKDYNALIYLANAISFVMQMRFDYLIRKIIRSIF